MGQPFDWGAITSALAQAAIDPTHWPSALQSVEKYTRSRGALLLPVIGNVPLISCTPSMEGAFETYIEEGWFERDERYRGTAALIQRGTITDDDCMAAEARKRSPYYQEFLAGQQLTDFVGVRIGRAGAVWNLSLQRSPQEDPYSRDEILSLQSLSNSLDSIAKTCVILASAKGKATVDAFQFSNQAALLLDRAGNVTLANATVEKIICSDLQIIRRRLKFSDRDGSQVLDRALRRLLWVKDVSLVPPIVLKKSTGGRFIIYPMAISKQTESPFSAWHAVLVIVDTDASISWALDTLRTAFDLSRAEAKLALAIGSGQDIAAFASRSGLSKDTVRSQLKSIFSKTGTHRQAEIVALLGSGPINRLA